jgi:hypothetical protein
MKVFVIALAAASALSLSAAPASYKVSVLQNSTVDGHEVKAGNYKVEMKDNNTAVLKHGKQAIEVPAREEASPTKYASTELQYTNNNDLQEIHIGGSTTKIVFAGETGTAGGGE